jgi:hypothetical protein
VLVAAQRPASESQLAPPVVVHAEMKPSSSNSNLNGHGERWRPALPIVEFAGTPRAGKTTAMHGLAQQLEARGHRVWMVEERARKCPIPSKLHPDFNLWTAVTTVADLLEARHADADVILVDRGIFDALCWMDWYASNGALLSEDQKTITGLLRTPLVAGTIDLVLVMTVEPVEALRRDRAGQPPSSPSPIVNKKTLRMVNRSISNVAERHIDEFPLVQLNTTSINQDRTLNVIEEAVFARYPGLAEQGSHAHQLRATKIGKLLDLLSNLRWLKDFKRVEWPIRYFDLARVLAPADKRRARSVLGVRGGPGGDPPTASDAGADDAIVR